MSPRWWHRSLLTQLPLTKRTTNNYSRTRHDWQILEDEGEAEHPLHHRDQDRLHQRISEVDTCLTSLPLTQASRAPCRAVFPEPLAPPVRKKNTEDNQQCPPALSHQPSSQQGSLCGGPFSHLAPWRLQVNLKVQPLGVCHWKKGWRKMCNNQHTDLGRLNSYLQCPTSSFAHLQNQVGVHSDQGTWGQI